MGDRVDVATQDDPYAVYMPDAVGYIKILEERVRLMRLKLEALQGRSIGCSCCPNRLTTYPFMAPVKTRYKFKDLGGPPMR